MQILVLFQWLIVTEKQITLYNKCEYIFGHVYMYIHTVWPPFSVLSLMGRMFGSCDLGFYLWSPSSSFHPSLCTSQTSSFLPQVIKITPHFSPFNLLLLADRPHYVVGNQKSLWNCCRKGDPFQGPSMGSCLMANSSLTEWTRWYVWSALYDA